jgi:ferrous-iron efflux pump FieF
VIAALALDSVAGIRGADGGFGLAIAAYLGWGAFGAARHAIDMLMDKEWDEEKRDRVKAIVAAHPAVHGIHELKTRTSGATDFIQFHVWVEPQMTVAAAHVVMDEIEDQVLAAFPGAEVLIHVDPAGHSERYWTAMDKEKTA